MTQQPGIQDLVAQARERLGRQLVLHTEQLDKFEKDVQGLRDHYLQLKADIDEQLGSLEKFELPAPTAKILASVQNLMTARFPEDVLTALAEEADRLGVRAAVFDVRGKAAWGACARGFGAQFSDKAFQSVIVSLSQDGPFRQVYESGGVADIAFEQLKKNRNVLDRLKPGADFSILLLPVRSAGSVSAIVYADTGDHAKSLPVDELKIFTEFAGAQLDRLMALSGGFSGAEEEDKQASASRAIPGDVHPEPVVDAHTTQPGIPGSKPVSEEAMVGHVPKAATAPEIANTQTAGSQPQIPQPAVSTFVPVETVPPSTPPSHPEAGPNPFSPAALVPDVPVSPAHGQRQVAANVDVSSLDEAEQKIHRDAKRFAKLLVSEIELYNKAKVTDGRQNKDLYTRLKPDIDRSRQTYDKRFGRTVAAQFDYFHDEMVRTLACQDASLLGVDYPGPAS